MYPNTFKPQKDCEVASGIFRTSIDGLLYIERSYYPDERGFFSEVTRINEIESASGTQFTIKQINHARSQQGVVRGIHAEDWNKLVFIASGVAFCAIVDVRPQSHTFGKKEYFIMGQKEDVLRGTLFIPQTLGNSVCVLEGPIDYIYCVDRLYKDRDPSGDLAISLFDPDIAIPWPITRDQMKISDRDINATTIRQKYPDKFA